MFTIFAVTTIKLMHSDGNCVFKLVHLPGLYDDHYKIMYTKILE